MITAEIDLKGLPWSEIIPALKKLRKEGHILTASVMDTKLRATGDQIAIDTIKQFVMDKKNLIDRDPGTKKECIGMLRRAMVKAQTLLDNGKLHTAIHELESDLQSVKKKLPREKIVKPFKG